MLALKLRKLIAVFMVWVIVSQPVLAVAVEDQTKTANDNLTTYQVDKTAVVKAENEESASTAAEHLTNKEKQLQFGNRLLNYYIKDRQKKGPEWLKRSEFAINFSKDSSPVYSFETIQPLNKVTKIGQQLFWQGRYARESASNSTGNVGFGWRKLAEDKSSLVGLNVFYDYGFQYNLARLGVGAEYFNKLSECRANWYYPLSSERLTETSYQTNGILYSYIHAVEGFDFEAGTSFIHAPWLKIFAGGYLWDNKYHENEAGYRLRSTMQLSPQVNMELGYTHSNLSHSLYGNIKYQLAFGGGSEIKKEKQLKANSTDLSGKLLQKVERDNNIKNERYTKFVWYTGSIKATVTNSITNTAIYGATVQAYQNGVAVGSAVTTNASGVAVLNGLNVGSYTVRASYAGGTYSNDVAVTVTKDSEAVESIALAVDGGTVNITATNTSGKALSGATVTATLNSSSTTVSSLSTKIINFVLGVQTAYASATPFAISKTTDANGVAEFTNLPQGSYTIRVTYNGYTMSSEEIGVSSKGTSIGTIIVPWVESSQQSVGSVMVNLSGTMSADNYTVTLTNTADSTKTYTATVNNVAQSTTISGVPVGSYSVALSAPSGYTAAANIASAMVTAGGSVTVGVISSQPVGSVVVNLSGTMSTANYTVTLTNTADSTKTYTAVVNSGTQSMTINNVPVGSYSVAVSVPIGYTAAANIASAVVSAGGSVTVSVISSQPVGSVVVNLSGTMSAANYTVTLTNSADSTKTYTAMVNSTAHSTTINNVPVGSYSVAVSAPSGYSAVANIASAVVAAGGSITVGVASSQEVIIEQPKITVNLTGDISTTNDYTVTLKDSTGKAVQTAKLNKNTTSTSFYGTAGSTYTVDIAAPSGYSVNPASSTFTLTSEGKTLAVTSGFYIVIIIEQPIIVKLVGYMSNTDYTVTLKDSTGKTVQTAKLNKNTTSISFTGMVGSTYTVDIAIARDDVTTGTYIASPQHSTFTLTMPGKMIDVVTWNQRII